MRILTAIVLLTACAAAAETPIKGLRLEGDANAGGNVISNYGGGTLVAVSNAPSLNAILTYGPDGIVWQQNSNLTITVTNTPFSQILGDPMDNTKLAAQLLARSNEAASASAAAAVAQAAAVAASNEAAYASASAAAAMAAAVVASNVSASTWRNPQWFEVDWLIVPTNAADHTAVATNLDTVVSRQTYNAIKQDRQAVISRVHGITSLGFVSLTQEVATVNSNGYVSHVSDGVAIIVISNGVFAKTNSLMMVSSGLMQDVIVGADTGTVRKACVDVADAGASGTTLVFDTATYTNLTFVRNTNLWLTPAPVALSIGASTNALTTPPSAWLGHTLLTTKHVLAATHAHAGVGSTLFWVSTNNSVTSAVVAASATIAGDITLLRLDRDVYLDPMKLLDYDDADAFPTRFDDFPLAVGCVHPDWRIQLMAGGESSLSSIYGTIIPPTFSSWTSRFHHLPDSGDSGCPVILSTGTELVVLWAMHWFGGSGPFVHLQASAVEAQISAWGDTNQVSYVNLGSYRRW